MIAALLLGLMELISFDFLFSMLVIGALAAAGAAFLGYGFTVQVFTFAIASVLALVLVRPALRRWIGRHNPGTETNTDALVGRAALTLAPVTGRDGQVKLAGETWSARAADPAVVIPEGVDVTVVRIEGATAVVSSRVTRDTSEKETA
ncbi:MAG: NfeD family protein [Kineosporiaceae bacterium]